MRAVAVPNKAPEDEALRGRLRFSGISLATPKDIWTTGGLWKARFSEIFPHAFDGKIGDFGLGLVSKLENPPKVGVAP